MRFEITAFAALVAASSYANEPGYYPASGSVPQTFETAAYSPPSAVQGRIAPCGAEVGCTDDTGAYGPSASYGAQRPAPGRGYCRVGSPCPSGPQGQPYQACQPTAPCAGQPYSQPQSGQPYSAPAVPYAAAPGMFAASAPRGEVSGESSSFGVRGFAVELPPMRFELPTIKFPSCVRFRRDAEMRVEESFAPFASGVPAVYGQLAPGGTAFATPVTPVAPVQQSVAFVQAAPQAAPAVPAAVPAAAQAAPACPTPQSSPNGENYGAPAAQSHAQPPCPPNYGQPQYNPQYHGLGPEECAPAAGAHQGENGQPGYQPNPYSTAPIPDPTREAAVPPPPAPPAEPAVSMLQQLSQHIALQQQVIAEQQQAMVELRKSIEETRRGLNATRGLAPAPTVVHAERLAAPPRRLETIEQPGSGISPVLFQQFDDGWLAPEEMEPVVRPSWAE